MKAGRAALANPEVRAVILDVDGTMYDQGRVRRTMAWRILRTYAFLPASLLRTVRIVQAYRRAQEELRLSERRFEDLAREQHRCAARHLDIDIDVVMSAVERWMEREPLDVVRASVRAGLRGFLHEARARGIRLGVVSDYPAAAKLEAMGVAHLFDAVVTAQDRDVQRFKPDPRGIAIALQRLNVPSEMALYVGDREDIDVEAAKRAQVRCVLIGGATYTVGCSDVISVTGFGELTRAVSW